jgi:plastocyanin
MRMRCVLVTALAAACGGSSPTSAGGGGSGNPPPPTATVMMSEYRFAPETLRVTAGSVVAWNNNGTMGHTSTSDAAVWSSPTVDPPGPPPPTCPYPPCGNTPGGDFQYKFMAAGTYPYHCAFHDSLGMKGVVIVSP